MDNFYKNELKSDSRIINTILTYGITYSFPLSFNKKTIEQYVAPLEYEEGRKYSDKFIWEENSKLKNYFWILRGYRYKYGDIYASAADHIGFNNNGSAADVQLTNVGARPVFWISLD